MNEIAAKDRGAVEYVPYGAADRIKLSILIVQKLIAVKTKSGQTCGEDDALRFIGMCQARRLNPLEGDAFLLGFDTQNGPKFQLITAHQAYLKRAELHPQFDGFESGAVVRTADGDVNLNTEILPEESQLIGGWCRVHLKERKIPVFKAIPLTRFKPQIMRQQEHGGPWRDDPCGMIVKCAEADALRSAFPTMLGGLYMREEVTLDVSPSNSELPTPKSSLVSILPVPARLKSSKDEAGQDDDLGPQTARQGVEKPTPIKDRAPAEETVQSQLAGFLAENDCSFSAFASWADKTGSLPDASSFPDFNSIPKPICERLLKAFKHPTSWKMIREQLAEVKGDLL